MKTLPITPTFIFPRNSRREHTDEAALGRAAAVELLLEFNSPHRAYGERAAGLLRALRFALLGPGSARLPQKPAPAPG